MPKLNNLSKKIKKGSKKFFFAGAERPFLLALFFLFLGLLLAGLFFYQARGAIQRKEAKEQRISLFKEEKFLQALSQYQKLKKESTSWDLQQLPDPFKEEFNKLK